MSYPYGLITELRETIDQLRAELAALKAWQGEAVAWEYQTFHDDNTVTPGWSAWERVEARHSHETVAGMVAELQDYIARGYRYRLRALYTTPPAPADAVSVPRELLERLETWVVEDCSALEDLRALLASGDEK